MSELVDEIFLIIFVVMGIVIGVGVCNIAAGWLGSIDEHPEVGTTTNLDLPINVTRIIHEEDTTFIYQARGDEESLLFSGLGWSRVVKDPTGNVIEVFTTESLKLGRILTKRPTLEMLIIRDNGSRETYALQTRDE